MFKEFIKNIKDFFYSDHPFVLLVNDIKEIMTSIWNFPIYITPEHQTISVSNVITGVFLFILGIKIAKGLSRHLRAKFLHNMDKDTAINIERVSYYLFLIIITIFVFDFANVPLTALTVIGTTLAVGIGLGSQHAANNFISGLVIMIEKPIKIGDIIEVNNIIGKVTNIGARCVSIRTSENINMLIPNSNILQDIVINWTHEDTTLKVALDFTINREANFDEFEKNIFNILQDNKMILKEPFPQILLKGYNKNGRCVGVEFWIDLLLNDRSEYIVNQINRELEIVLINTNIEIIETDIKRRDKIVNSSSN